MKNRELIFEDWNTLEYNKAYTKQLEYKNSIIELKKNLQSTKNIIVFVEHPHVYTLGKHGKNVNLLISEKKLREINATFVHTDRGGDITYHGYGQIVIYPIIDLDNFNLHVKKFVYLLEESIIKTLREFNIETTRLEKAPGVWIQKNNRPEKICAIGIKIEKNVSMHGLALNVKTDLSYFNYINPCGYTDKGATSMEKETKKEISIDSVKKILKEKFIYCFKNQEEILKEI